MSKNKKRLAVYAVIFGVILSGYTFLEKVPDLVNVSGPFIDLSGSVGNSIGNAKDAYEAELAGPEPTTAPTPVPTVEPTPTPTQGVQPTPIAVVTPASRIEIWVGDDTVANPAADRGEIISIHNRGSFGVDMDARTFEKLEDALKYLTDMKMDKAVVLVDNYAETNTFKAVKKALADRNITPTLSPIK